MAFSSAVGPPELGRVALASKRKKKQREIASRLLLLRERLFDNASDMARSVKLSPQAWYNYETGRRSLDAEIAAIVVEEHGVDYNWLYGGSLDTLEDEVRKLIEGGGQPPQPSSALQRKTAAKRKRASRKRKTHRDNDNNGADPHR
jgi:hypothetical protein